MNHQKELEWNRIFDEFDDEKYIEEDDSDDEDYFKPSC